MSCLFYLCYCLRSADLWHMVALGCSWPPVDVLLQWPKVKSKHTKLLLNIPKLGHWEKGRSCSTNSSVPFDRWEMPPPATCLSQRVTAWCPTNISLGAPSYTKHIRKGWLKAGNNNQGQVPHKHAAYTSLAEFICMQQLAMANGR